MSDWEREKGVNQLHEEVTPWLRKLILIFMPRRKRKRRCMRIWTLKIRTRSSSWEEIRLMMMIRCRRAHGVPPVVRVSSHHLLHWWTLQINTSIHTFFLQRQEIFLLFSFDLFLVLAISFFLDASNRVHPL